MLTILGVDPGTITVGVAMINADGPLTLRGAWTVPLKGELNDRLASWAQVYETFLSRHDKPGIISVENPMVARNMRVVDALARFVGVTVALARLRGLLVIEYRPTQHRLLSIAKGIRTIRFLPERREVYDGLRRQFTQFPTFKQIDEHQLDAISLALAARRDYEHRD